VLLEELPAKGTVLEVASGSGEHACFFAQALPNVTWQPTEVDERALASIATYRVDANLRNLLPPVRLNAAAEHWPISGADAILCINMIHIAPWRTCEGLFAGAARTLAAAKAPLILYGPFRFHGRFTAESNAHFDEELRNQDPEWGVRDVNDLARLAQSVDFALEREVACPANNHILVFRRL
jgi:hypothetical protein